MPGALQGSDANCLGNERLDTAYIDYFDGNVVLAWFWILKPPWFNYLNVAVVLNVAS